MATTLANISIKDSSSWNTYLNLIYPVGSYYLSNSSTSPATRFGGTWSALTGRFLYCNAGTGTGGANTHNHSLYGYGNAMLTTNSSHIRYHYGGRNTNWSPNYYLRVDTHAGSIDDGTSTSDPVDLIGNTSTANNMPAYKTCYCWYRTA